MTSVRIHPVEEDGKLLAVALAQDIAAEETIDGKTRTHGVLIGLSELDHVITVLTDLLALANKQEL